MAQKKNIPVGLEMYSVRNALAKDIMGTTAQVCDMGYKDVEFFAPYYDWSTRADQGSSQAAGRQGRHLSFHSQPYARLSAREYSENHRL